MVSFLQDQLDHKAQVALPEQLELQVLAEQLVSQVQQAQQVPQE